MERQIVIERQRPSSRAISTEDLERGCRHLVPRSRVVKAPTRSPRVLDRSARGGGQRVILLSGDDIDREGEVISLFASGFSTIDLGA